MYLDNSIVYEDMKYIYGRNLEWDKLRNKKFLITGAYGMLASYIVFFLMFLNINYNFKIKVFAQGRNEQKAREKFGEFWDNEFFEYINIDICKKITQIPPIDFYIHSAGIANPKLYLTHPVEVIEPNVLGTYYLLDFARDTGCEKFLLFSSGDVYGSVDNPAEIRESTVGKMDPLDTHSCYGESKRLAETLCGSFFREYHIPTTIARIAHTYGPTMDVYNDPRSFASFMRCALKGEDIVMFSDGSAKRPFCYISDAVFGYMLILLRGKNGEAYNVGNSKQLISIAELAATITDISEKDIKVVRKERNTSFVENSLNICNKLIEDKLIALGWKCKHDIRTGMEKTYYFLKSTKK